MPAGQTGVDAGEGADVGPGLKVGRQGVAHAGDQETGGCTGNNRGIDQDNAGTLLEVGIVIKLTVFGVEHGGVAGRSVRSCNGGNDDNAVTLTHAFGGVDGLAAAHTYDTGALVFLSDLPQALHFLAGALAMEVAGDEGHTEFFGSFVQLFLDALHVAVQRDQQGGIAKGLDEVAQVQQFVLTLDVLGRADKGFSHNKDLPYNFAGRGSAPASGLAQ